jgi:hypothetical protein
VRRRLRARRRRGGHRRSVRRGSLRLVELQPAGGRRMSAAAFLPAAASARRALRRGRREPRASGRSCRKLSAGEPCGAPRARRVDAPAALAARGSPRARRHGPPARARPGARLRNAPALGERSTRLHRSSSRSRSPTRPLRCLIAVALYQLDHTRAPPFAIVDHAVNAAAIVARPAAKPLANAVLRRYLRERESLACSDPRRPGCPMVAPVVVDRAPRARLSRRLGVDSRCRKCASAPRVAVQSSR